MEKQKLSLQHVQVPNNMCLEHTLEPFDMLVYACIKRFMNQQTGEAFPSIRTLQQMLGCHPQKIKASIDRLRGKYFSTYFDGRKQVYVFSGKYRNFEPFSYEFLDKQDLTYMEKAYVVAIQQYMFKDVEDLGKVSFTTKQLSDLINMPEWEIWKHDRSLQDKGYLNLVKTKNRDFATGLPMTERMFDMEKLGQHLIWLLFKNTQRIRQNSERIKKLQKDLMMMRKLVAQQGKEITKLKKIRVQSEVNVEL